MTQFKKLLDFKTLWMTGRGLSSNYFACRAGRYKYELCSLRQVPPNAIAPTAGMASVETIYTISGMTQSEHELGFPSQMVSTLPIVPSVQTQTYLLQLFP